MKKMTLAEILSELSSENRYIVEAWALQVCACGNEVDPDQELDWRALWIGFALGKGMAMNLARDYAFYDDYAYLFESAIEVNVQER